MLERYTPILNAIKNLCPTAHIAGGAVRDTLLERPIKDVDLFLDTVSAEAAAKLPRSEFGFVKVGEWANYEMFSDPAVDRVAKFERADETIPVCLIGLKSRYDENLDEHVSCGIRTNLARFDYGLCKASWDGETVYTAPEYKRDIEQKTFTLCRADNWAQFHYSMTRFDKMTADRYAGWRLAVPLEFEAMAKEHALKKTHYFDNNTDVWMPREIEGVIGPNLLTPKAR